MASARGSDRAAKGSYIVAYANDAHKSAWQVARDEGQALSRPIGNILDLIVNKVEQYAPVSFQAFKAQQGSPSSDAQMSKSAPGSSNPTANRPSSQPGPINPSSNHIGNNFPVQPPNSQPNTGPSGSRPAGSEATQYLKTWQTASIIRQAAEAGDYPDNINSIVASHHSAVGNAAPVLKSQLELVNNLKAIVATSTDKRKINKWAKNAGYQP